MQIGLERCSVASVERKNGGPSCVPIANEGPGDTPSQIDRKDVAEPNVGGLQKDLTTVRHTELFIIEDNGTNGGQNNDTSKVDPMEPPRRPVPHGIGLKVHLRHWRLACSPRPQILEVLSRSGSTPDEPVELVGFRQRQRLWATPPSHNRAEEFTNTGGESHR